MAANVKEKVIQIQKPAQSLEAFKAKAAVPDAEEGLLKPLAMAGGAVVLVVALVVGYRSWSQGRLEKYEAALAEIHLAVEGDRLAPPAPADLEKRMREQLPRLEALAQGAPGSRKAEAQAILAAWKLQVEGKGGIELSPEKPWDRLRVAQRQVALAQGKEALATLEPLRTKADRDQPWGHLYWMTLIEAHRVTGNREQAWKDLAEYKQRFKEQADTATLERVITGI